MTNEGNVPLESAIVEVNPETQDLVKQEPNTDEQVKNETIALIEAIKTKAQSEAQKAGDFSRENYLNAVRAAREQIEMMNLFDPERVDESMKQVQQEVEKDWETLVKQVSVLGDRLGDAAKAAWDVLTAPRPDDTKPGS